MADEVSDLRFFTHIIAAGTLSAAARLLGASPAAMSRRLAALETRLGVRLVSRTTRTFELTPEGALLNERALRILSEIDEAEAEASAGGATPRGPLRIGVPLEIGRRRIAPLVTEFVDLYPKVEAHLVLSDARLDVVDDGLDVALHVGTPPAQGLVTTKILSSDLVVCAAPAYIERCGLPLHPRDVLGHNCIRFKRGQRLIGVWSFEVDGKPLDLRVHGNLVATSAEVVHDWVLAGKGLALKPLWDIAADIASGRLVVCLAEFRHVQLVLNAVYLGRRHLPPRVRLFIDFIKTHLK